MSVLKNLISNQHVVEYNMRAKIDALLAIFEHVDTDFWSVAGLSISQ
jgi:hypothetical protein